MAEGRSGPAPHARFEDAAATYRLRPDYPPEAIAWLAGEAGAREGSTAIDIGAGTGLLAAHLVRLGLEVTAVEPNASMRAELVRSVPGVTVCDARAEALPAGDGAFDIAVAGNAYHWFDPEMALPEVHRVVRDGGHFAVAWILPDLSDPLQVEIRRLSWEKLSRAERPGPLPDDPLGWDRWFDPPATGEFPFTRTLAGSDLPAYVASFSVIAVLDEDEKRSALEEARGWAAPGEEVTLPYRAVIHLGRRRGVPT